MREPLAGKDIQKSISESLKKTDYLLLIISDNSAKSNWVNFEVSQFVGSENAGGARAALTAASLATYNTTEAHPVAHKWRRVGYLLPKLKNITKQH